jgi:DNA-binding NtrC family response regulator
VEFPDDEADLLAKIQKSPGVVLLDLRDDNGQAGIESEAPLLNKLFGLESSPPVVVMVRMDDHALVLRVMDWGACDTIPCPPDMAELRLVLRRAEKLRRMEAELAELRAREQAAPHLHELIGASDGMQQVFAMAQKIATCDVSVLVSGETGTGKELLARAIHRLSSRANFPFVAFSCASLPETLVEDELFGHEKGAFTGAMMARRGRFEVADRGTMFLDEIGDLSLGLQAKLLRVLQERSFERLGSNTAVKTDIRLVCATNKELGKMVEEGKFREDLYYRLNVVQLHLPPLRERREDIPFLAHHFLRSFADRFGRKVQRFSRVALHALEEFDWPGNVRELENVIQRAVVMADGSKIELEHLPGRLHRGFEDIELARSYEEEVREFKRRLIVRTLHECGWCKQDAAKSLGLARSYLHRLINQLEISEVEEGLPAKSPEGFTGSEPVN